MGDMCQPSHCSTFCHNHSLVIIQFAVIWTLVLSLLKDICKSFIWTPYVTRWNFIPLFPFPIMSNFTAFIDLPMGFKVWLWLAYILNNVEYLLFLDILNCKCECECLINVIITLFVFIWKLCFNNINYWKWKLQVKIIFYFIFLKKYFYTFIYNKVLL